LQNGWYVQRFAPMLRVAVPYGELSSRQLRVLATIARDYDRKDNNHLDNANPGLSDLASLPSGYAHFTTRHNLHYNWIPLHRSADLMDLLASVDMHGIQTSGNCIRNITRINLHFPKFSDGRASTAPCCAPTRTPPWCSARWRGSPASTRGMRWPPNPASPEPDHARKQAAAKALARWPASEGPLVPVDTAPHRTAGTALLS